MENRKLYDSMKECADNFAKWVDATSETVKAWLSVNSMIDDVNSVDNALISM